MIWNLKLSPRTKRQLLNFARQQENLNGMRSNQRGILKLFLMAAMGRNEPLNLNARPNLEN
ncbi:hypothetical protein ZMTM_16300 [Methyloradius palustris]|uniref:Uncharacterized protein n=1 Tax=Methyloradius palustris TaxID=2778876 RepID=A0A8D5G938_9PROT|nr:hypothetical protein ZMTM_16300 [Methyloradius palustris]